MAADAVEAATNAVGKDAATLKVIVFEEPFL